MQVKTGKKKEKAMRQESCGLKSLMLEVRGGTRDTNKGWKGEKKKK